MMTPKTYLDHLPEKKQRNIKAIRDIILNEFERVTDAAQGKKKHCKIKHIILYGSYAKGEYTDDPTNSYISDYDILITLNNKNMIEDYELWNRVEDKAERRVHSPVSLIIHTIDEVAKCLSQGQYFFSDIQQEGIYLHLADNKGLPDPKKLTNAERKPIAQEHFDQWFKKANGFYRTYELVHAENDLNQAAFQLHQSAERYYSTVLLVLINYIPKTHNLKRLHSLTIQYEDEIATVFPQDSHFHRRCFSLLKRAYVDARYSEHYTITEEELDWLANQVNHLKQVTESTCLNHIKSL